VQDVRHRAKVIKDQDSNIWVALCDCEQAWQGTRWQDIYGKAFNHVHNARRFERAGGVGFHGGKNELH
jgi:hypothetical protein